MIEIIQKKSGSFLRGKLCQKHFLNFYLCSPYIFVFTMCYSSLVNTIFNESFKQ